MSYAAVASAARFVLATVLIVAAVSKLRALDETRRELVALLGPTFGAPLTTLLPVVELAIAVMLLVWRSAVPGVLAIILLLAFSAVLVRAQVKQLPCACFGGGIGDAPPSPATVFRNGALLACAVLATGSPSGANPIAAVISTAVLGAIVGATAWYAR
jgi:hypothetical protein